MRNDYEDFKKTTNDMAHLIDQMQDKKWSYDQILTYLISFDIIDRNQAIDILDLKFAQLKLAVGNPKYIPSNLIEYNVFAMAFSSGLNAGMSYRESYAAAEAYVREQKGLKISPKNYMSMMIATALQ